MVNVPHRNEVLGELLAIGCKRLRSNGQRFIVGVKPRDQGDAGWSLVAPDPTAPPRIVGVLPERDPLED
jgi:hypothetical protein